MHSGCWSSQVMSCSSSSVYRINFGPALGGRAFAGRHLADQLSRSTKAPGAHYEEARGAESRNDFVHKVKLANKELRETRYWLRIANHRQLLPANDLDTMTREATELIAILTASAKTASQSTSQ